MALLDVHDLSVRFDTPDGAVHAVNRLSFSLERGRTLGIVGESGSGKSQTVLALMGLLARNGHAQGRVRLDGQELLGLDDAALNRVRGQRMAMIFQDPMTALNPYLTVERQMTEVLQVHQGMGRREARTRALQMLDAVKIPEASRRLSMYPHEFSGGMRQRVMIAMALLCEPEVLLADEPTTALDVTVQAQILALLRELQRDHGTAIVMITHDLGVVAGLCDEVLVMYGGSVMEQGPAEAMFGQPAHPYTLSLLAALPRLDDAQSAEDGSLSHPHRLRAIPGMPPHMARLPAGCAFSERCPVVQAPCAHLRPALALQTSTAKLAGAGADQATATRRACHLDATAVRAYFAKGVA